jgi:hypothetical protein
VFFSCFYARHEHGAFHARPCVGSARRISLPCQPGCVDELGFLSTGVDEAVAEWQAAHARVEAPLPLRQCG